MLNLDELVFKANTTELDGVIAKLDKLQQTATQLNTVTAKVDAAQKKQVKAQEEAAKATERQTKATEDAAEAEKKRMSALEKQQTILEYMREGYSKGQATTLAFAKATGTLTNDLEQLGTVLKNQRKLQGSDAFDASVGGLEKLRNQYGLLTESVKLHSTASELTSKQAIELSRDIMRLTDVMKSAGKTEAEITAKIKEHTDAYKATAAQVIQLEQAERTKMKTERDRLNAITGLAKEEERIKTIRDTLANTATAEFQANEKTATSLARYSQMLKNAGVSSSDYVTKLDAYKKKLMEVQALEERQKTQYITRAVGPQLTDIFSGLATGQQSLYTILVQQGGQLADQFALAGIQANKMGDVLKNALPQMLGNITNIGKALGTMVAGGFLSAGQAAGKFMSDITGVTWVMDKLKSKFASEGEAGFSKIGEVMSAARVASVALATSLAILTGYAIALAVAFKQVYDEGVMLNKTLNLQGGAMGLNADMAYTYAESMKGIGITTSKALEVMVEMAKAQNLTRDEMQMITKAAVDLEKFGGVAIEETVKQFSKLKDKPVDALRDVAKATGLIHPEIIKMVSLLEEQGNKSEAAALAMTAYSKAVSQTTANIIRDMGILETLFISIGSVAKSMWDKILNIGRPDTLEKQLSDIQAKLTERLQEGKKWYQLTDAAYGEEIQKLKEIEASIKAQIQVRKDEADQREKQSEFAKLEAEYSKDKNKYLSDENKLKRDLLETENKYREYIKAGLADEKEMYAALAKIKESYSKKDKDKKPKKTELQKEFEQFEKYLSDIQDKASGFNKNYSEMLRSLDIAFVEGWFSKDAQENLDRYNQAVALLEKSQPGVIAAHNKAKAAAKEAADALMKLNKQYEELTDAVVKYSETYMGNKARIQSENSELQFRLSILGLTSDEQEKLTKEYKRQADIAKVINTYEAERQKILSDKNLMLDPNEMRIALNQIEEIRDADISIINAKASVEAIEEVDKKFREFKTGIADGISSALLDGGQVGAKKIRDVLVAELRKPITIAINAMVNSMFGGPSASNSVGASIGTNTVMGGLTGLTTGLGAGVTSIAQAGVGGWLSASTSLMGTGTLSGVGAGLGMLAGPIALVAGITSLIKSLDDSGTLHTGGISSYSATTGTRTSTTHGAFGTGFGGVELGEATTKMTSELVKSIVGVLDSTAKVFGKEAGYSAATAFADDTSKDGAWGALVIEQFGKALVNWDESRTSKWAPKEFADGEAGQKQYLAAVAKDVAGVLKSMDLPKWAADILESIGTDPSMEALTAALAEIQAMPEKILGVIGTSSSALSEIIIKGMKDSEPEKAGEEFANAITFGIENAVYSGFANQISSIVSTQVVTPVVTALLSGATVTEAMSKASINTMLAQVKTVTTAMSSLLSDPTFKEALDTLNKTISETMKGIIATGSSFGFQKGNGGVVKETVDQNNALGSSYEYVVDSTSKTVDSLKSLQDEGKNLQAQLYTLQGRTSEANAILYALATEGMSEAEKAAYDWNLELKKQIKSETEYRDLQAKVWQATGQIAKLREKELAALEPANRAIQQWLWNLEDTAAALDKAAEAQGRLLDFARTNVESTFDVLSRSVDALRKQAEEYAKATDNAYSLLEKAINTSMESSKDAVEKATEARDAAKDLFKYLSDEVKALYGTVTSTSGMQAQAGRNLILQAISTGVLPDSDALKEAIDAVKGNLDKQLYSTKVQADKARLTFANELNDLAAISNDTLTESEKQLQVSEEAVKSLEDILVKAKEQIDSLRGIDTRVLSVDEAIAEFQDAYLKEQAALAEASTATAMLEYAQKQLDALNGVKAISSEIKTLLADFMAAVAAQAGIQGNKQILTGSGGAVFNTETQTGKTSSGSVFNQMDLEAIKSWHLAGNATQDRYQELYGIVASSGFTLSQAESMLGAPAGSFEAWSKANNLPTFATGGFHDGGMALVGERGSELINTGPARVFNASQTAGILASAGKSSEGTDQAILNELSLLRAEVRSVAVSTSKTYIVLDRAVQPDDSLAVTVQNATTNPVNTVVV